jgi:hypothetical protein
MTMHTAVWHGEQAERFIDEAHNHIRTIGTVHNNEGARRNAEVKIQLAQAHLHAGDLLISIEQSKK